MVIWIIGMSGAGKTVIGREVYRILKSKTPNVVFIDGDTIREIMGKEVGYILIDEKADADRICRLCKFLPFPEPEDPDLIVDNDVPLESFEEIAKKCEFHAMEGQEERVEGIYNLFVSLYQQRPSERPRRLYVQRV